MRDRPACVLHQIAQHLELFRAEVNFLPLLLDTIPSGIKHNGPDDVGESGGTGNVLERRIAERNLAVNSRIWKGFVT